MTVDLTCVAREGSAGAAICRDDFDFLAVVGKGSFGKVFLVRKRGGPDAGAVYALKSLRKEVLLRKAYPDRAEFKFEGNQATEHGTLHEPDAIAKYQKATGREVLEFGFIIHETIPWLGASPDGIATDGVVVEVKCPRSRALEYDEAGIAKVPLHYLPRKYPLVPLAAFSALLLTRVCCRDSAAAGGLPAGALRFRAAADRRSDLAQSTGVRHHTGGPGP